MAIGGVVINFVAKTADAVTDTKKLSRVVGGLGDAGKKAGGKQGLGGLVSSMGAAVPIVGAAVIGVVGAAAALGDMAKAAWEDKRQSERLAGVLKNIPGVTQAMIDKNEEWITSMQLATLVSDTELRDAVQKLTLATGDLEEAQTLAALAADVAAGSGKDYAAVAGAMAAAAAGNTGKLEKMYPWLEKNKDGSIDLADAQKQLGDKFKGAAGEAAKNDPWKRIATIWDELQETIGGALVPVLEDLSDWFSSKKNQDKIKEFLVKAEDLATVVGEKLLQAFRDLVKWLKDPKNQQKMKDWANQAKDLAEFMWDVVQAVKSVIDWIKRIPSPPGWLDKIPGLGLGGGLFSAPAPPAAGATATATTRAAPATPAPTPTIVVTEEQVYRAVQRLLMRGQARNGRLVMVG